MSEQVFQDALIDVDALLEELQNLPPMTEAYDYFTRTESGTTYITKELDDIYSGFIGQFLMPDITTYVDLYNRLASLVDLGLRTAGHRKQVRPPDIILCSGLQYTSRLLTFWRYDFCYEGT